jgi:hypothetical protein
MPHIKRVFHYKISAEEINKIMGRWPKDMGDGEIEFVNHIIDKELENMRDTILNAIIHAKGEFERYVKRQEALQRLLTQTSKEVQTTD